MNIVSCTSLFLAITLACSSALGDEVMHALEKEGTRLRLSGDFSSAKIIENKLIEGYTPVSIHH